MGLPRRGKDQPVPTLEYEAECKVSLVGDFPELGEFLARVRWPDGSPRRCGTLLVVAQDGMWKGCLTCKETFQKCWVSATTLQDLLELLERGLVESALPWRNDEWQLRAEEVKRGGGRKGK